jgi:histidyl-tRNA synthetase
MTSTQPKAKQFQAIKGVRDILPPESALWNRVEQTAREVFGTFGFAEIRVPIFEQTELFARSIGAETDVVSKEMYTFEDHDQPDLARLRSAILLWEPLQDEIQRFLTQLRSFQTAFERVYQAGNIPRTPDNDRARQLLLDSIRDIQDYLSSFSDTRVENPTPTFERVGDSGISVAQFPTPGPRFEDSVRDVGRVLQSIKLGNEVTLRPEATASVVRAYIEHGMQVLPGNVKLFYMGPMFRRERPQKGRYRQFYQIGAEVLGTSDAPGIDAEVIEMLMRLFERLNLKGAVLNINSIGDKNCRPAYVEKLRAELQKVRDQLGADSQRRIETNPLRVLDSKLESEQGIIEKLPRIAEHLCADCRAHYDEVKRQLGMRGIAYQENWRLVRGLDYYMRTTFEITAPGLGSQNAVCGGGRYDGLVELLGGPATTKGIGFAIGTDRLVLSLRESGEGEAPGGPAGKALGPDVYLAWFGAAAQTAAIGLARRLRDAGFVVELPAVEMKFGKSLGLADRLKSRHAVIVGDDELAAGVVTVKRLSDGTQQKLAEAELFSYLRAS